MANSGPRGMSRKPRRSKSDDTFDRLTEPSVFEQINRPTKENIVVYAIYLLLVATIETIGIQTIDESPSMSSISMIDIVVSKSLKAIL